MTVVERTKIEMREMEGYDISDIDYENYVHDRIVQEIEQCIHRVLYPIKKILKHGEKHGK